MAKSKTPKDRSEPPRTGERSGESYTFYMSDDVAAALEAYRKSLDPLKPSKKAVIEAAMTEYLAKHGFWPPK